MQHGSPSRPRLIGRHQPLEDLKSAVRAARNGTGSLVLLSGEPGIGKTRLAEEVAESADGLRILWGRCHEIEGRPPFWPWIQVLQACARDADPRAFAANLPSDLMPLAQFAPNLRPFVDATAATALPLDSAAARFRLFQAMTELLRRDAAERPLLLILDDLHWADAPSLLLLEFLAHEVQQTAIATVGTYRQIEVRQEPLLSEVIGRLVRHATTIPLTGLTTDEVARFVNAATGERVSQDVAGRLRRETEGNPFFLDEILRLTRADRSGVRGPITGTRVPQGVRGTIQQRLSPLDAEARRILEVAAVAGREFDLPLLEAALEKPRAVVVERLTRAMAIEVVSPVPGRVGGYRFSHALVTETLREGLPAHERAAWHQRFGEILEARRDTHNESKLAEIAHHYFESAVLGNEARALTYAERAGIQALQLLAYEEAALQFDRALQLTDLGPGISPDHRCELLLRLGDAKNRAGQEEESTRAYHAAAALARSLRAPALLARAAIGLCGVGTGWTEFGRSDELLVGILREALEQLDHEELALRARVLSRLATESYWARPPVDTNGLSAQAVDLARRSGDAATLGYALVGRLHCIAEPQRVSERAEIIDELLRLSGGLGELALHAHLWRFGDLQQVGRMADARACGDRLIEAVDASRQPGDQWLAAAVRAQRALLEGRLDDAERAVETILAQRTRKANAEQAAVALLFLVRREQGRQAELAEGMRAFAYESPSDVGVWRASLALLYAETDALAEARLELDALAGERLDSLQRDNGWTLALASLAVTCAACGSREQAERIYAHLASFEKENVAGGPFCFMGPVSYYLGLLAHRRDEFADAMRHFDTALAAAEAAGAQPAIARILLAQANTLDRQGTVAQDVATDLRRRAAEIAERLGLIGVAHAAARDRRSRVDVATTPLPRSAARLRKDGSGWVLLYENRVSRLKDIRGMSYLARLLGTPGDEVHALDLSASLQPRGSVALGGDLGPDFDARARREVRDRLRDLRRDLEEAEANADIGRTERVRSEIDAIESAVSHSLGLGGRHRPSGTAAERARAAVTKALRAAIREVERHEPTLGEALRATIKTGLFCAYTPGVSVPIDWET